MAELTGSETDHQPDFSHETYQTELGTDADGRSIMTTVESSGKSQSTYMEISIDTINTSSTQSLDTNSDDSQLNRSTDTNTIGPHGDNNSIEKQPLEKKPRTTFVPGDVSSVDSGKLTTDSLSSSGSKHGSGSGSSNKSPQHQGKDTSRKDKEREERIRQQREKLAEERQKKIEEMKEQQRLAQEKREKQLELRRMKIDELRRRDEERRSAVEDRRKKQETAERTRREAILQKSAERITRYEQWKASGRKGGVRGPYGFGSRAPREVCQPLDRRRSSSHSTLYRRSPNGSDSDTYRPQRRAVSACSVVRRHCCIDINKLTGMFPGSSPPSKLLSMSTSVLYHKRSSEFSSSGNLSARDRPESLLALNTIPENSRSFLAPSGPPPTRPKSTYNLSNREHVKMRDKARAERKPRPKSVAGSMPSFIQMESTTSSPKTKEPKATSRSKSTDRIARDRQKNVPSPRLTTKKEKDDINKQEKSSEKDEKKDTKKRFETRKPLAERKKPEVKKTDDKKKAEDEKEDKPAEKPTQKISQKTLDRLSTPKQTRDKSETRADTTTKETTPVKVIKKSVTIIAPTPPSRKSKTQKQKEKQIKESPAKDKLPTKELPTKDTSVTEGASEKTEESLVKEVSEITEPSPEPTTVDETVSTVKVSEEKESTVEPESGVADQQEESPKEAVSEGEEEAQPAPIATPIKPEQKVADQKKQGESPAPSKLEQKPSTPAAGTPQSDKEKEMLEYKAKLAEKRRQAREKAEREAELERQRLEELQRQEEERIRREEEEQRKMEEEAHRLAEEARRLEEERLRKAIEAEEQRKKEEAERLEKERIAKEEAEKKAKEEAEKAEIERLEKLRKEEEERLERKKRLEMIMKRVKSDTPLSSPALSDTKTTDSPNKSLTSSPSKSSHASTESLSDDKSQENGVTFTLDDNKEMEKDKLLETPKFKSPLLQKLVENKQSQNGSETPKFKSPLLQNLLGKKKVSSRLGIERSDGDKSDSEATSDSERYGDAGESSEELDEKATDCYSEENDTTVCEKVDSADSVQMDSSVDMSESVDKSDTSDNTLSEQKDSVIKSDSSDILVTINGPSQNGDMGHYQQDLVDSSISMRTVDSLGTSVTTDSSLCGSLIDSQITSSTYSEEQVSSTTAHTGEDFEEYIDLTVNNRNTIISNSEDLLNFNSIDNKLDNITSEDSHPKPIIAFEDNATRRQEVTDLLS